MFLSKSGTPISIHNYRNRLAVLLTFQVLRRSHATRNQKRAKDAQMHLGHRSIVTTMNIYAQEIPESVKQMVEEDEAVLKAKPEQKTRKPAGTKL